MSSSDPRDALDDLVKGIRHTFQQYSTTARRKSWQALISPEGRKKIDGLVVNPRQPVTGLPKLIGSFKEWLSSNSSEDAS